MSEQVEGQLTLFQAGFPASLSPLPGSEEARRMTATSGRKWLGLSKNSGPLGWLEKMLLESSEWHSPIYYLSWGGLGYRTRTFLIPACAVGARHRRYRVAIVAYTDGGRRIHGQDEVNTDERGRQTQHKTGKCGEDVANAKGERLQRIWEGGNKEFNVGFKEGKSKRCSNVSDTHNGLRERKRTIKPILGGMADGIPGWMDRDLDFLINHYWDEEPGIKRIASGITHRTDRIKCLGNAVVPQQFFPIFKAIKEIEEA